MFGFWIKKSCRIYLMKLTKVLLLSLSLLPVCLFGQEEDSVVVHRISLDHALGGTQSELFSDVHYTVLSSDRNNILDEVNSMFYHDGRIFIGDKRNVYSFQLDGKLLWKHTLGKTVPSNFYHIRFDPGTRQIVAYVAGLGGGLIQLDLEGNLIQTDSRSRTLIDSINNSGTIWRFNAAYQNTEHALEKLEGDSITPVYPYYRDGRGIAPGLTVNVPGFRGPFSKGQYFAHYRFWPDLIEITRDNQLIKHRIVYPAGNAFDITQTSFDSHVALGDFVTQNTSFIFDYASILPYKDYLIFMPMFTRDYRFHYAYNLKSGTLFNLGGFEPDEYSNMLPVTSRFQAPMTVDEEDDYLYTLIFPFDIMPLMEAGKLDLTVPLVKAISASKNPTLVRFKLFK